MDKVAGFKAGLIRVCEKVESRVVSRLWFELGGHCCAVLRWGRLEKHTPHEN